MLLLQQEAQREGDGTTQAAVRNDELVLGGQLDDAELVDKVGQTDNTCEKKRWEKPLLDLQHKLSEKEVKLASAKNRKEKRKRFSGSDLPSMIYNQSTRQVASMQTQNS